MPESQQDPKSHCSMWFIGLEFKKMEGLNVNLTHDIQLFTENVNKHAVNIQLFKTTMKLEARHVKRKQVRPVSISYLKKKNTVIINSTVLSKCEIAGKRAKKRSTLTLEEDRGR